MKYIVIFFMFSIYILEYNASPVFNLVELSEKQSDKLSHKLGDKLNDKQSIHNISREEKHGQGEKRSC